MERAWKIFCIAGVVWMAGTSFIRRPEPVLRPLPQPALGEELAAYPFIRGDQNQLHFPGGMDRWNVLFERLEAVAFGGEGALSIAHIGGSHVQGGWLTDRLRGHFNTLTYGVQGARGLVFPYQMAGTNSPRSISCAWTGSWAGCRSSLSTHACEWGMTGITASTADSLATFTVGAMAADSTWYSFDHLIVYHQASPGYCVMPDPGVTTTHIYENESGGYTEFWFHPAVERFTCEIVRLSDEPGTFGLQGVFLGDRAEGITYNPIGVNGAGTYSYLRCKGFDAQLATLSPDLVVFAVGVNDANVPESDFSREAYESRCDSLIRSFLSANPSACFLFVTNNDTYYHNRRPNRNALQIREAMVSLARRHGGAVYDLFDVMGGLGSIDLWMHSGLAARDRVHFSRKGYELQADLMFDAFRKSFGNYLSLRGS